MKHDWGEQHIVKRRGLPERLERHGVVYKHAQFAKGERLLDIGCGLGEFFDGLSYANLDLVGIDIDIHCLRQSRLAGHSKLALAEACSLPFPDNSFDWITAIDVIEHVPNPVQFVNEVRRICRGHAIIVTPNLCRPSRMINAARNRIKVEVAGHKQGWDYHLFKQVLEVQGWKVDKIVTRFVDLPFYELFPKRFAQYMSYVVLQRLFPKIGSELFAFCSVTK